MLEQHVSSLLSSFHIVLCTENFKDIQFSKHFCKEICCLCCERGAVTPTTSIPAHSCVWIPSLLGSGHVSGCQTAQLPSKMGSPPCLCWLLMRKGCGFIKSLAQGNPWGLDYMGIQLALHVSRLSEQIWEQIDGLNWILLLMCQMDHLGRFLNLNVWLWSTTLWGSWIPSICHPPAHNSAQKLHFSEVHPILGGYHGNRGTTGRCRSCCSSTSVSESWITKALFYGLYC